MYWLATSGATNLLILCQSDSVILTKFWKPLYRRYLRDLLRWLHTKDLCFSFNINYMWTEYGNLSWKTLFARTVFGIQCGNIVNVFGFSRHHGLEFKDKAVLIRGKASDMSTIHRRNAVGKLNRAPIGNSKNYAYETIPVSSMETAALSVILHILIVPYWNVGIKGRNPLTYSVNTSSHVLAKYNAVPNSGASWQKYHTSSTGFAFFVWEYCTI